MASTARRRRETQGQYRRRNRDVKEALGRTMEARESDRAKKQVTKKQGKKSRLQALKEKRARGEELTGREKKLLKLLGGG